MLSVLRDTDPELAETAHGTLRSVAPDRLASFVRSGGVAEDELDLIARESEDPFVLEEIVRSRAARDETLLFLARNVSGRPQDALIANQARLLAQPALVGALFENPNLTVEGRRLLSELTEEFFEKEARRRVELARRAAETEVPVAEAAPEDLGSLEDLEGEDLDSGEEEPDAFDTAAETDEAADSLFIGAIYRRIGMMTISEKIKLAYVGSKEERRILVGDTNKLIGIAVLKSRALSVNEVETFAAMRNVDEEIFRRIVLNREWMRKPAVVVALVRNPRVPRDITLPLLKRLPVRELRAVSRDRNLAPVLRTSARRLLMVKRR
ncbi:MAG TPA: hypothetical protein VGK08_00430 [Thermoanaerobaculia bacterium]